MRLTQIIEALLFASDAPLTAADLLRVDERLDEDTVEAVVEELRAEYELTERSFQLYEVAGGYQLLTRPEFVSVLERYDSVPQPARLSAPALEVLAIIAYRQPLGRAEIEEIRGVGSSGVLRTLTERSLVEPVARGEGLGRPLLYGTTSKFLEHFGFRSLEDLPRPDELPVVLRDRTVTPALPLEPPAADGDTGSAGGAAAPEGSAAPEGAAGQEGTPVGGGAAAPEDGAAAAANTASNDTPASADAPGPAIETAAEEADASADGPATPVTQSDATADDATRDLATAVEAAADRVAAHAADATAEAETDPAESVHAEAAATDAAATEADAGEADRAGADQPATAEAADDEADEDRAERSLRAVEGVREP